MSFNANNSNAQADGNANATVNANAIANIDTNADITIDDNVETEIQQQVETSTEKAIGNDGGQTVDMKMVERRFKTLELDNAAHKAQLKELKDEFGKFGAQMETMISLLKAKPTKDPSELKAVHEVKVRKDELGEKSNVLGDISIGESDPDESDAGESDAGESLKSDAMSEVSNSSMKSVEEYSFVKKKNIQLERDYLSFHERLGSKLNKTKADQEWIKMSKEAYLPSHQNVNSFESFKIYYTNILKYKKEFMIPDEILRNQIIDAAAKLKLKEFSDLVKLATARYSNGDPATPIHHQLILSQVQTKVARLLSDDILRDVDANLGSQNDIANTMAKISILVDNHYSSNPGQFTRSTWINIFRKLSQSLGQAPKQIVDNIEDSTIRHNLNNIINSKAEVSQIAAIINMEYYQAWQAFLSSAQFLTMLGTFSSKGKAKNKESDRICAICGDKNHNFYTCPVYARLRKDKKLSYNKKEKLYVLDGKTKLPIAKGEYILKKYSKHFPNEASENKEDARPTNGTN